MHVSDVVGDLQKTLESQMRKDLQDAKRWRKLMKLVGTPANASDSAVKFWWDDATMTPFIVVGYRQEKKYHVERGSFESVMDSIPEPEE